MHDLPQTRRSAMRQSSTLYIGLDVHKDSVAVAYVVKAHDAEVTFLGTMKFPCDTRDVRPYPCIEENPLCRGALYSTSPRRSKPRCWRRCGAHGTAICWPSISCCDVRRGADPRRSQPCSFARAPVCTGLYGLIARGAWAW